MADDEMVPRQEQTEPLIAQRPTWAGPPATSPNPNPAYPVANPWPQQVATSNYAVAPPARPVARVGGAHIAVAWVFAVLTIGYFLPWAIAATRQKSNTLAIGLVNFLLGWTAVGWVVALVMACLAEPTGNQVTVVQTVTTGSAPPPPGWYPDSRGEQRYWDGARWL